MSYNEVQDVLNKFRILGEQYEDPDIQDELDRAQRRVHGRIGNKLQEVKRARINDQEIFHLAYEDLISFDAVYEYNYYEYEEIDDGNYTTDTENGTITFNTDYAEDNIGRGKTYLFSYEPQRFKDLELYYAIASLVETLSIQNRDGENAINLNQINETITNIENELKIKVGNAVIRDHMKRHPPHF